MLSAALPFKELTNQLENELKRLHYTDGSLQCYRRMWNRIAHFMNENGIKHFDEEAGLRFLDEEFNFFALEKTGQLTQSIINVFRVVRMLRDFEQHKSIVRRYYKHKNLLQSDEMTALWLDYQNYCAHKDYAIATQNHYKKISETFLSFVESQHIDQASSISSQHVSAYIKTLLGYSYKTVEQKLCGLRSFLRYLHESQRHAKDLSETIPPLKSRKRTRIPSVWSQEHVTRLIEAIDRGNPAGKRDYAMILLVARLGLRSKDVKHLMLTDLKWHSNSIELMQSKTSEVLLLPLLPDVGWAVIDYLKNGRPKIDSPYVFLRHLAPIVPFSDDDHLHQVIVKYMRVAKIPISLKKRKGMHSLRHTLASKLLEENTPLPVISDILGHVSTDSTAVYLKVSVDRLRECSLNPDGVFES